MNTFIVNPAADPVLLSSEIDMRLAAIKSLGLVLSSYSTGCSDDTENLQGAFYVVHELARSLEQLLAAQAKAGGAK